MQSNGSYQEYIALYTSYLCVLPESDSVTDAEMAPILCGGVTAYKAIKKSEAKPGDWIVIAGAGGGLGNFAVQYAVAMGMQVIGIYTGEDKKKRLLELGAHAFVDFREDEVVSKILSITNVGAHVVIVIAPSESTYNQALEYTRIQGRIVCVGLPHDRARMQIPPGLVIHQDLTIKGSMVGTHNDIGETLGYVVRGLVKPDIVVYPVDNITTIFKKMESNEVIGRAVLDLTR